MNRLYNFDINMTENCSLKCTYCIQNFNKPHLKNIDDKLLDKCLEKFDFLLKTEEFLKKYPGIRISFWGGEPTTNVGGLKKILNKYGNNPKVQFFMYSNGYNYSKEIYDLLFEYRKVKINNEPKWLTQISYDGLASHDTDRLNLQGKGSALKVKETVFELHKKGIPFIVHPTIAVKNFDKIAANYFEFRRISSILNIELNYSPTIDYMSKYNFTDAEMNNIIETLKKEFFKIKDAEIEFYKKKGYFSFGWMNPNKAICTAGDGYSGINIDGNILPCHGSFNEPDTYEMSITNKLDVSNEEFLKNLLDQDNRFRSILSAPLSEECRNCTTHYCLKCNSTKCSISTKDILEERWVDYNNQPDLCKMFKFIGKFRMALMRVICS